ncbi:MULTISPECIES: MDR family MFS transporter [Saccharothrix]|uniref:MDR family MFS transporter n=1 Tax=Saccharothrix TaxID=2071 RepID=UPI00093999A1|nr:MDR family MFS transporter [Saccharothrix sp. CB00851]
MRDTNTDIDADRGRQPAAVRLILVGLFAGVFMSALDGMIMATALRTVADSLHGLTAQAWVTTTYLMAMTISAPLYGKLSDIFGRKNLYLVSVGLFTVGSLLCALAQSIYQLAVFRGVQGLGAGGLSALAMAAIADLFPPEKRIRYQANVGILYGVASVGGPVLGGLFASTESLAGIAGWRWIFLLNLPIGLVTFVVVARLFTVRPARVDHRVDYGGALALVIALVPALLVTEQGSQWGWTSTPALVSYVVSAAGLVLFVLVERAVGDHALLPFRLLRIPAFAQVNVINFLGGVAAFTPVLLIPLYLQIVKEMSPIQAGLLLFPQAIAMTIGAKLCGPVIARTGRYKVLLAPGLALVSLAMFALSAVDRTTSVYPIVAIIFVMGLGLGVFMQTVLTALQNSVPKTDLGIASGMYGFSRQIGGIAGTAIFISLLFSLAATRIVDHFRAALPTPGMTAALADPAVLSDPATMRVVAGLRDGTGGLDLNDTSALHGLDPRIAEPILDGMASSLNTVFLVIAFLVAAAAALALGLSERGRPVTARERSARPDDPVELDAQDERQTGDPTR